MELKSGLAFLILASFGCMNVSFGRFLGDGFNKGGVLRRLSLLSERVNFRENGRGGWLFSDEIELSFDIEGLGVRNYRANKVKYSNSIKPRIVKMVDGTGVKVEDDRRQAIGYYANSEGSFACTPSIINGQRHCDLVALIHDGKESCFIKGDNAYCQENANKTNKFDNVPVTREIHQRNDAAATITKPYNGNRTGRPIASQRHKRQISSVTSGTRVVHIAYYLDQAFMEKFYSLNPSNDTLAEEDATIFTIMLNNEMTYRFQEITTYRLSYRGGIFELATNPSAIIYPAKGEDLPFIEKSGNTMRAATLNSFVEYVRDNPPEASFQHAMLLSRLDFYTEYDIVGQVPSLSVVCSPTQSELSVSVNEDLDIDVMLTMIHELGHSLGARHDGDPLVPCRPGRWIMSPYAVDPANEAERDSINRFSRCSAEHMRDALESYPDCLGRPTDDDFLENFCVGPRGFRGLSLDTQCQTWFEFGPTYTECDGADKVEPDQCWKWDSVFCYPGTGDFCYPLTWISDGTPCNGPREDTDYYCYLGECVEEEELCRDGPPVTLPPPPPPPPCLCDNSFTRLGRFICCLFNSCC